MPIDIDENLVNSAIIEFHTAIDIGRSHAQAWAAAVSRVRYEVLTLASVTCESVAQRLALESDAKAEAAHACAHAIRDLY